MELRLGSPHQLKSHLFCGLQFKKSEVDSNFSACRDNLVEWNRQERGRWDIQSWIRGEETLYSVHLLIVWLPDGQHQPVPSEQGSYFHRYGRWSWHLQQYWLVTVMWSLLCPPHATPASQFLCGLGFPIATPRMLLCIKMCVYGSNYMKVRSWRWAFVQYS